MRSSSNLVGPLVAILVLAPLDIFLFLWMRRRGIKIDLKRALSDAIYGLALACFGLVMIFIVFSALELTRKL